MKQYELEKLLVLFICPSATYSRLRKIIIIQCFTQTEVVQSECASPDRSTKTAPESGSLLLHVKIRGLSERQASSSDCCCRIHMWNKSQGERRSADLGWGAPGLPRCRDRGWRRGYVLSSHGVVVHVNGVGQSLHRQRAVIVLESVVLVPAEQQTTGS